MQEDLNSGAAYRKIFEQVMKDKMENEYNRTKVKDRRGILINALKKEQFVLNQLHSPRIIESFNPSR